MGMKRGLSPSPRRCLRLLTLVAMLHINQAFTNPSLAFTENQGIIVGRRAVRIHDAARHPFSALMMAPKDKSMTAEEIKKDLEDYLEKRKQLNADENAKK